MVKSNILTNISPEIKQILLSRVLTSLEDKLDRTTLIIGQIDRTGKSNGDSVDSESEGYLLRLFNFCLSCIKKNNIDYGKKCLHKTV